MNKFLWWSWCKLVRICPRCEQSLMKFDGSSGWHYWPHCLTKSCAQNELQEALAAVDDFSDGSRHDWRRFAHVLARAYRAMTTRCAKHEGHEHCVTPCDSIRIQEENHNTYLVLSDKLKAVEEERDALIKDVADLNRGMSSRGYRKRDAIDSMNLVKDGLLRTEKERDSALARVKELESRTGAVTPMTAEPSDPQDEPSACLPSASDSVRLSRALAVIEMADLTLDSARNFMADELGAEDNERPLSPVLDALSAIRDFREGK